MLVRHGLTLCHHTWTTTVGPPGKCHYTSATIVGPPHDLGRQSTYIVVLPVHRGTS